MTSFKLNVSRAARVIGLALLVGSSASAAHASTAALKATQDMFVHSYDGMGCEDVTSKPNMGRMMSGSCIEFQIKIKNNDYSTTAKAINFKNPVDKGLVFITAVTEGFAGGTLDIPAMNTDCSKQLCLVKIQDGSIKPKQTGILKIRAIVK